MLNPAFGSVITGGMLSVNTRTSADARDAPNAARMKNDAARIGSLILSGIITDLPGEDGDTPRPPSRNDGAPGAQNRSQGNAQRGREIHHANAPHALSALPNASPGRGAVRSRGAIVHMRAVS